MGVWIMRAHELTWIFFEPSSFFFFSLCSAWRLKEDVERERRGDSLVWFKIELTSYEGFFLMFFLMF